MNKRVTYVSFRSRKSKYVFTAGTSAFVIAFLTVVIAPAVVGTTPQTTPQEQRNRYDINLTLDFDALSYSGSQRVRWINRGSASTSVLYFHLYSNLRPYGASGADSSSANEEPRLEVLSVNSPADDSPINYSIEDQGANLRINLREPVNAGESTEVVIKFRGNVPEVEADETGLTSHVIKQVSAALRGERELRRPRDLNFKCKGVMLIGTPHPVLAVQDGGDWMRRVDASVGDFIFNEVADYEVSIDAPADVKTFTSATKNAGTSGNNTQKFSGHALRDLAIIAGRTLRSEEKQVGEVTVTSIFLPEHERIGKRVLTMTEDALNVFTRRFGPLPYKSINISEAPLVAGLGSTEFSGLEIIASAYYVDFDSASVRSLPEIIREQRPAVEESLEWSVARLTAHQWWGGAVGNDPARAPVLDEALSSWSALLYFRHTYGEEKAAMILDDQLKGVYRVYRTFGGEDMNANRPSRDYRNSFQYAAVVATKGALMFVQLQNVMSEDKLVASLQNYYQQEFLQIAELDDLRNALVDAAPLDKKRLVARTFQRWLTARHGDEDIAGPDKELATTLGLPSRPAQKGGDRNALGAFARVGKFFWQQMTRIR